MQKIIPFLWFDNNAEEAINHYSAIKNSKVVNMARYGDAGPGPKGSLMTATFQLEGQEFIALNGGPMFKFTEAVSFIVKCHTQEEVDHYWERLLEGGGTPQPCGWLKDRFGLSWQIIPDVLGQLLGNPDREKAGRAMQAMLQMKKIDIAALEKAFNG